jgi:fatty-acyl-CoA synthase
MHSQRMIAYHSLRVARAFSFAEPDARLFAALPFCGVFGLNATLAAFAAGAPVVIMEVFEGARAAELVRRHAITHTFGSDEMYRRMADAVAGEDPFPSARLFGFAIFQPGAGELAEALWARRIPLVGLYGSSEVQALFSVQPISLPLDQRIAGGGRPASDEAEVRIRDIDSGELAPIGASGEIEIRAPSNFVGYLNNPEATVEAVRTDRFFRTGDIGHLREDGTFVYETRKGDAIRLGGFLVNPVEIEDALKRIPSVADVQVIAIEIAGQFRPVAFVIPARGTHPAEDEVIAAARPLIAAFKVPARVWFVEEFPTTQSANGTKVQRAKLREMALERMATR